MISIEKKREGEWQTEDLARIKEAYSLTLKKERLLLSQGQFNYLAGEKVVNITQEVADFDGLIAKITEEVRKSNPLMYIKQPNNDQLSTISFQDVSLFLTERANEEIDYWPSHFSTRAEYMAWLKG